MDNWTYLIDIIYCLETNYNMITRCRASVSMAVGRYRSWVHSKLSLRSLFSSLSSSISLINFLRWAPLLPLLIWGKRSGTESYFRMCYTLVSLAARMTHKVYLEDKKTVCMEHTTPWITKIGKDRNLTHQVLDLVTFLQWSKYDVTLVAL